MIKTRQRTIYHQDYLVKSEDISDLHKKHCNITGLEDIKGTKS